jgi:protein gp37
VNKTAIPWCDWTWNPIVGCSPASPGCANCYAAAISRRFHLPWGSAHFMPERLDQPARVRKPGRVFVCSMADIGHGTVKPEWREAVYEAMRAAPWHTFIILTKRPAALARDQPPVNVWMGVSVCEQDEDKHTWGVLQKRRHHEERILFVSVEPMLGPVTFTLWGLRPDWVIAGPETGPKARRCDDAWIDALAEESPCFFDKRDQWARREFPVQADGADLDVPY